MILSLREDMLFIINDKRVILNNLRICSKVFSENLAKIASNVLSLKSQ
jgi:hypothetical protein